MPQRLLGPITMNNNKNNLYNDDYNRRMDNLDKKQIAEIVEWCELYDLKYNVCIPEDNQHCIYVRPNNQHINEGYNLAINVTRGSYVQVIDGIIGANIYQWPQDDWRNIPDLQRARNKKSTN